MNINEINSLDGEFISDLNNLNYNVHEINDNGYIHFNSKNNYYAEVKIIIMLIISIIILIQIKININKLLKKIILLRMNLKIISISAMN